MADTETGDDTSRELEIYLTKIIDSKPNQETIYIDRNDLQEMDLRQDQIAQVLEMMQKIMYSSYSKTGFVRLSGFSNLMKLKDIQASEVHKFVTIQGTIVRLISIVNSR